MQIRSWPAIGCRTTSRASATSARLGLVRCDGGITAVFADRSSAPVAVVNEYQVNGTVEIFLKYYHA